VALHCSYSISNCFFCDSVKIETIREMSPENCLNKLFMREGESFFIRYLFTFAHSFSWSHVKRTPSSCENTLATKPSLNIPFLCPFH
jgi:hypothetical protein